ncbi:MAG TPA: GNAT family N-acetyltransferase [Candidatus Limnocylindrales bacterium]|nr:GNAT family N-acetyltransferase [Candidatus Limnocylindrales bacterium]
MTSGADFALRPLQASDGPAIDALIRGEAQTTAMAMSTHYGHDVVAAMAAQHPTMFGVVATTSDGDEIVGMATAFIDEVQLGDRTLPCAHLENLKVRHDVRRRGLGRRLAEWRIAEARRRFGGEGVIAAGIDATNEASLATARRWATDVDGPLRVVIGRVSSRAPARSTIIVRPLEDRDVEAVVAGANAFYSGYSLYPPQTPGSLASAHAQTALGLPIRQYRVAVRPDGTIVAGASVTERFRIMTDHIERVPIPLALLSKVFSILPPDRVIRSIELSLAWHAPGHAAAGRHLWDAIRHEWRDRATHVTGIADPRGSLGDLFVVGRSFGPRVALMVAIQAPVPLDESRPIYLWR